MTKIGLGVTLVALMLGLGACGNQDASAGASSSAKAAESSQAATTKAKPEAAKRQQGSKASSRVDAASDSQASSRQSAAAEQSSSTVASEQALWSPAKADKLAQFMRDWGVTMKQQYQSYWTGHSVSFYGVLAPDEFDSMRPALDDAPLDYGLSTDGTSAHQYAIVAIYSDAETAGFGGMHLYLFALDEGQPVVLVTMQNQGNENNWLYFNPSQNAALQNGFAAIVND